MKYISACAPDILTMNMTHTGELGYVFYIPNEFALHVYNSIIEAGKVSSYIFFRQAKTSTLIGSV